MRRIASSLIVVLLLTLGGTTGAADKSGEVHRPPATTSEDAPIEFGLSGERPKTPAEPAAVVETLPGEAISEAQVIEGMLDEEVARQELAWPWGYNTRKSNTSWLIADSRNLGMFSLESLPVMPAGEGWNIVWGLGFHFLSGPTVTDMPPRLFDFQIGLQQRKWLTESFGYDVVGRIGAFSDFEGSAREGVRFPSHAVGFWKQSDAFQVVAGIDYLDRDDVSILPVAGVILTPRPEWRLELLFPRPRAIYRLNNANSIYMGGELGGGTWAIERVTGNDDVATYRDFRLLFGWCSHGKEGEGASALEIGYVFGRELEYRSGLGDAGFRDVVLIQLSQVY